MNVETKRIAAAPIRRTLRLKASRERAAAHPIEEVGRRLRDLTP